MRDEFERWISAPPIEADVARYPESGPWPGQYCDYKVQLAWEAWTTGTLNERKACATPTTATKDAEIEALRAEVRDAYAAADSKAGWEWKKRAEAAEASTKRLAEALRRYRNEVPLGHQPHMLAHEVDTLLRDQENEGDS